MKIQPYIIAVAILLLTFSSAANKAIADLGQVKIDDLFYNSGAPSINGEIKKIEFDQVDKILIKNEDLELESLEIADIDLATFGEYETFLNKYYDDNYTEIKLKSIKQIGFEVNTTLGGRVPFGENTKAFLDTGSDWGLSVSPITTFYISNIELKPYVEFNKTFLNPKSLTEEVSYILSRYTLGSSFILTKNLYSRIGLSLNMAEGGYNTNPEKKMGFSANIDLGYNFISIKNLQIGVFARAQTMFNAVTNPPIDAASTGTIETLSFGLQFASPLYLSY